MASIKAKHGAIREAFTRSLNDWLQKLIIPQKDLNEIQSLKKQLEYRFSSLENVDEEFERNIQEKDTTEEKYTAENDSTFKYRGEYGNISLIVNILKHLDLKRNNYYN